MGFIFSFCVLALTLVANIAVAQSVASGAVSGQFEVTPLGSASYSIPISLPPGTAGMEPKLSLVYDSSENRGHFGMGWNLTGLSKITRCAPSLIDDNIQSGIEFSSTDRFCLDGQKLVAINGAYGADNTEYRTQIETFSTATSFGQLPGASGPQYFQVRLKNGLTYRYGFNLVGGTCHGCAKICSVSAIYCAFFGG